MYLVIPSIELLEHKSRCRVNGEHGTQDFYGKLSDIPEDLCKLFRLENVKSIQVTDIDSFIDYENNNIDNICLMTEATFLPFQALSNCQTKEDCRKLLEYGVHRIILADYAANKPAEVKELIKEYSDRRIIFFLPIKSGKVYFEYSSQEYGLIEYLEYLKSLGATRVVLSILDSDSEIIPDKNTITLLRDYFPKWTYQYNAINYSELEQIKILTEYNMDSLVIAESFYGYNFPCQKIWRIAEARLDAPKNKITAD